MKAKQNGDMKAVGLAKPKSHKARARPGAPASGAWSWNNPNAVLRAYAEGRINHVFLGQCPDEIEGHDVRDEDCPVCCALNALQQDNPPDVEANSIDLEVLSERLRDVASSHYETAMAFGISRDNFERCANDAAKVVQDMVSQSQNSDAQGAALWRAYSAQFPAISASFVADQAQAAAFPREVHICAAMIQSARNAYDKARFPELNKWKKALNAAISDFPVAGPAGHTKMSVTAAMVRAARDAYHSATLSEEDCWNCALRAALTDFHKQESL